MLDWFRKTLSHIWEGFLNNLGVLIPAFLFSGGYLFVINTVNDVRTTVRKIPTDYVLTPLVLLSIAVVVLLRITRRQKLQLAQFAQPVLHDESESALVTHFGVWWRVHRDDEYIEDFPYCSCCDPHRKLVQTAWHPDEVFVCPGTKTEYKLYDRVPRTRDVVLENLYDTYYDRNGMRLHSTLHRENAYLKERNPTKSERDILLMQFERPPLKFIPQEEREFILQKCQTLNDVFGLLRNHLKEYRKMMRENKKSSS